MQNMLRLIFCTLMVGALASPGSAQLELNQLSGFGASADGVNRTAGTEITRTLGTLFSDFTSADTEAMDGGTNDTAANSAQKSTATSFYVGRSEVGSARYLSKAEIYGSNNAGYVATIDPNVTAKLYGKNGSDAPADCSDGVLLGSITFVDQTNESAARTITSSDLTSTYEHRFICVSHDGAAAGMRFQEVKFFE